jgi:hypothetical protein
MAPPPASTYFPIPPPPLSEFYRSDRAARKPRSHAALTAANTAGGPETRNFHWSQSQFRARSCHPADERQEYVRTTTEPVRVSSVVSDDPTSSLATYHICRICLRPRSARYHYEHPIPADGLPPPPGICQRCRVSAVSDSNRLSDVTLQRQSNDLRMGVGCLVADSDYFSTQEITGNGARRVFYEADWQEVNPPYPSQHLNTRYPKNIPSSLTGQSKVFHSEFQYTIPPPPHFLSSQMNLFGPTIHDTIDSERQESRQPVSVSYKSTVVPPEPPRQERGRSASMHVINDRNLRQLDSMKPSPSVNASSLDECGRDQSAKVLSAKVSSTAQPPGSVRTESEIRRLARDEVIRYRRAERKIETHRDPYAHGRMVEVKRVPADRRIALEKDVAEDVPWLPRPSREPAIKTSKRNPADLIVDSFHDTDGEEVVLVRRAQAPAEEISMPTSTTASDKTRWPVTIELRESSKFSGKQSSNDANRREKAPRSSVDVKAETRQTFRPQKRAEEKEANTIVSASDHEQLRLLNANANAFSYELDRHVDLTRKLGTSLREGTASTSKHEVAWESPREEAQSSQTPKRASESHTSRVRPPIERDYIYTRRIITPSHRPDEFARPRNDDYYKETTEFLHRRQTAAGEDDQGSRRRPVVVRRASDTSSGVRFSKKLDISPTPPDSDANSSNFRNFARIKGQIDGQSSEDGEAGAVEYERRGRPTSYMPPRNDPVQCVEEERDRDRTPRPAPWGRRRSRDSKAPLLARTSHSVVQGLNGGLSESPSRESLRLRRQPDDGYGPYSAKVNKSASVQSIDGSTETSTTHSSSQESRHERP